MQLLRFLCLMLVAAVYATNTTNSTERVKCIIKKRTTQPVLNGTEPLAINSTMTKKKCTLKSTNSTTPSPTRKRCVQKTPKPPTHKKCTPKATTSNQTPAPTREKCTLVTRVPGSTPIPTKKKCTIKTQPPSGYSTQTPSATTPTNPPLSQTPTSSPTAYRGTPSPGTSTSSPLLSPTPTPKHKCSLKPPPYKSHDKTKAPNTTTVPPPVVGCPTRPVANGTCVGFWMHCENGERCTRGSTCVDKVCRPDKVGYEQCGGLGWMDATVCGADLGWQCKQQSAYFAQCIPTATLCM